MGAGNDDRVQLIAIERGFNDDTEQLEKLFEL